MEFKKDKSCKNEILLTILIQIKNIAILLNPIIPESTEKIFKVLNLKDIKLNDIKDQKIFNFDKPLEKSDILFKKIED